MVIGNKNALRPKVAEDSYIVNNSTKNNKKVINLSYRKALGSLAIISKRLEPALFLNIKIRDVAQLGSAPVLGTGGHRFKSCHLEKKGAFSSVGRTQVSKT